MQAKTNEGAAESTDGREPATAEKRETAVQKRTQRSGTADREIVQTRIIHAPRATVFEAWTKPEHIDQWWGPNGYLTTTSVMQVKPGGEWRCVMRHAQHGEFPNRVRYHEVVAPERLAYTHDAGVDDDPAAFEVTVTFTDQGDDTLVTMRSVFQSVAEVERVKGFGAVELGQQTLAKCDAYLSKA